MYYIFNKLAGSVLNKLNYILFKYCITVNHNLFNKVIFFLYHSPSFSFNYLKFYTIHSMICLDLLFYSLEDFDHCNNVKRIDNFYVQLKIIADYKFNF